MGGFDNLSETTTTIATDYIIGHGDYNIFVANAGTAVIVELPDGALIPPGRTFCIYKTAAAGDVDITSGGSSTIDNQVGAIMASGAVHSKEFVSDGENYFTVSSY